MWKKFEIYMNDIGYDIYTMDRELLCEKYHEFMTIEEL